jgi:hypothetical protein
LQAARRSAIARQSAQRLLGALAVANHIVRVARLKAPRRPVSES